MTHPETALKYQVKKFAKLFSSLTFNKKTFIIDGVRFTLDDLQRMVTEMEMNAVYVEYLENCAARALEAHGWSSERLLGQQTVPIARSQRIIPAERRFPNGSFIILVLLEHQLL